MTSEGFEDGIERRVTALERRFDRFEDKLDTLIEGLHAFRHEVDARFTAVDARFTAVEARLVRIETSLESKASAADVAELRGMVKNLPNFVQMTTLVFGILVGAFAIARFGLPRP